MTKAILIACTLTLAIVFCSGFTGEVPFLDRGPDAAAPTPAPTEVPTVVPIRVPTATATAEAVDPPPAADAPLVPGLNPESVLAQFAEGDRMLCGGWDPFWNVWEGYCYTQAPPYPAYVISVFSRTMDTVDNIQASVYLEDGPDLEVIAAFFEEVLNLPYEGADPETILAWARAELTSADLYEFTFEEMTHNGIPYTLSGTITFGINLDIGTIEPFIELP
jgi:hypothetical protein